MKEIGQFSDLAKQFGANAHFWEYRYWGTEFGRNFDAVNVCSPAHPLHEELLSGLRGIADLPHIRLSPVLKGLAHPVKRRPCHFCPLLLLLRPDRYFQKIPAKRDVLLF